MSIAVSVQNATRRRKSVPTAARIRSWVAAALDGHKRDAEITVRIVGMREAAELNRHWRKIDKATNVLSFPISGSQPGPAPLMGDVVVCAPIVAREAKEQGKTMQAHWAHMIIHATLHLLGYDHEKREDAKIMESREIGLLDKLGYPDPYC